jgi:predicted transposase YbfD/YdcC
LPVLHTPCLLSNVAETTDDECDVSGLLEMLDTVNDPRSPRGRIYGLSFLLAATFVAVLAGAKNFYAVERRIADFSVSLLAKLGGTWCYFRQGYRLPGEKTIRVLLNEIDADELDRLFGEWLFRNTRSDDDGSLLRLAIDGKVMRGAWIDENDTFMLLSAMIHDAGVTVAQVAVPAGTNEITQVENLLDTLPTGREQSVLVTMDAAHTQRDTAEYVAGKRGFDYVLTIKGNQPSLQEAVVKAMVPVLKDHGPECDVTERGHGRIKRWRTWTTDAGDIDFPHLKRIACIRRDTWTLDGTWTSKEIALTGASNPEMSATEFHAHVRKHWGIENKNHYVRDTVWREDTHQARTKNGPRNMAILRNVAIGVLRINGHGNITAATEWIAGNRDRALPLLATLSNRRHVKRT